MVSEYNLKLMDKKLLQRKLKEYINSSHCETVCLLVLRNPVTHINIRKTRSSTVKVLLRGFYCLALYASPHAHMESKMGFRLLPSSVSEYSTLGGTSA